MVTPRQSRPLTGWRGRDVGQPSFLAAVRSTASEGQNLLQGEVRRLGLQGRVVDIRRSFTGEDTWHPRVRIAEAPDGVGDALSNQQARLQHLAVVGILGELFGSGDGQRRTNVHLGERDLESETVSYT